MSLPSAILDATGHRWVAALAAFDFDIKYRPGRYAADTGQLSRFPGIQEQDVISTDAIKAICQLQPVPLIETLALSNDVLEPLHHTQQIHPFDVRAAQHEDAIRADWIYFVQRQHMPRNHALPTSQESTIFRKNFQKFKIKNDILYRQILLDDGTVGSEFSLLFPLHWWLRYNVIHTTEWDIEDEIRSHHSSEIGSFSLGCRMILTDVSRDARAAFYARPLYTTERR